MFQIQFLKKENQTQQQHSNTTSSCNTIFHQNAQILWWATHDSKHDPHSKSMISKMLDRQDHRMAPWLMVAPWLMDRRLRLERAKKIQEAISVRIEDRSFERLRGTFDEIEVEGGGWWWWWWRWDRTDRIIDVGQRGKQ